MTTSGCRQQTAAQHRIRFYFKLPQIKFVFVKLRELKFGSIATQPFAARTKQHSFAMKKTDYLLHSSRSSFTWLPKNTILSFRNFAIGSVAPWPGSCAWATEGLKLNPNTDLNPRIRFDGS
uniref:Uncharacterized protein n=1 Tax=Kalanchoe fedtschenkoi TaxID=63787 RepID=A0A7N0TFV5_KALFE